MFRIALGGRAIRHKLAGAGMPDLLCRALDFGCFNLRPVVTQHSVRWKERKAPFLLRVNDPMHYDLALGIHEPEVTDLLLARVKAGMTVFDIGANVGYFTILCAKLVGTQGRVIAVEGDPEVAGLLKKNVELNGLSNVNVVAGAVGKTCGVLRFGRARASGWSGLHAGSPDEWIEVPAYTVDSLAKQFALERIDLVKMDVEGAEGEVIEGMRLSLEKYRPAILLEVHPGDDESLSLLRGAGYEARRIERDTDSAHFLAERAALPSVKAASNSESGGVNG